MPHREGVSGAARLFFGFFMLIYVHSAFFTNFRPSPFFLCGYYKKVDYFAFFELILSV